MTAGGRPIRCVADADLVGVAPSVPTKAARQGRAHVATEVALEARERSAHGVACGTPIAFGRHALGPCLALGLSLHRTIPTQLAGIPDWIATACSALRVVQTSVEINGARRACPKRCPCAARRDDDRYCNSNETSLHGLIRTSAAVTVERVMYPEVTVCVHAGMNVAFPPPGRSPVLMLVAPA